MNVEFPGAVPEIPVTDMTRSKDQVDELHQRWKGNGASIFHPPESKEWSKLHEFVVTDPDGNFIRVFYNF